MPPAHRWLGPFILTLALHPSACHGTTVAEACEEPYECPDEDTINCMPPVAVENESACSGPCAEWLADNCDVQYVH